MQKKELNIAVGQRIQSVREKRKLTQEMLAELLDVGVQHISNVERGVTGISLTALVRLCEVLNVSADYLLRGVNSGEPNSEIDEKLLCLSPEQAAAFNEGMNRILDSMII